MPKLARTTAVAANVVFLGYLILFAAVRQSPVLWASVAIEVAAFGLILGYRKWKRGRQAHLREREALTRVERAFRPLYFGTRIFAGVCTVVLGLILVYMTADFVALSLASAGKHGPAQGLYRLLTPPRELQLRPAFTLELLAGANIEAGNYSKALDLERTLLNVRSTFYGPTSEPVAEIYTSMGDVCVRAGMASMAERRYGRSICLIKELRLRQGYGNPMTKLACLLRDEGRLDEARSCFEDALMVRTKVFGPESVKVAETRIEFARLLTEEGLVEGGQRMREQAKMALEKAARDRVRRDVAPNALTIVVAAMTITVVCLRGKVLAWLATCVKR